MSELERLGIDPTPNISIGGVGLNRSEHEAYQVMADPMPFIDKAVKTEEYKTFSDQDKQTSLQMIINQFQDNAEKEILGSHEFFNDFRQRIREAQ